MNTILGYRELSENDIATINKIKEIGREFNDLFRTFENDVEIDQYWLAIGKTHLQEGLMAIIRSIAKPEGF